MAGLELLFTLVQPDLSSPHDAIVCCLHWEIIHKGLKCIGSGDQLPENVAQQKKTEMLPKDWNVARDVYALLYADKENKVYTLKVLRMENVLMAHFMRMSDELMADVPLDVSRFVSEDLSTVDSAYTDLGALQHKFRTEVLDKVLITSRQRSTGSSQSSESRGQRSDPDGVTDPLRAPPHGSCIGGSGRMPQVDPFSIGRADLDPLAGGVGGGMIFDPLRSGMPRRGIPDTDSGLPRGLPPGAVPPGARFDPFGPPGAGPRGGRPGPDPDHLPPPGFDDMFM